MQHLIRKVWSKRTQISVQILSRTCLAESPAKEPKAVVADRIPKLPKNVHWAVKAVVEPYSEDRKEVMALMSLSFLCMMGGDARFLYRNQEVHHLGFECCLVGEQSIGKSALTRMQNVLISKVIEADNETRQKSDEYADECIAAGEGKEKPKDPHYGTRIMMPSTTKAQFYQNIKNLKGKRAIIVCPEIDSLNVANNWSRDGGANERLMFDTEVGRSGHEESCRNECTSACSGEPCHEWYA